MSNPMSRPAPQPQAADPDFHYRTALSRAALKQAFLDNLLYVQGKFPALATAHDYYLALACTVRDRIMQRWISTAAAYTHQGSRTVCYLSAEFLMGPHLGNNLLNLGIQDEVGAAMSELGLDLATLLTRESEPGLGNGGLGRLAACFLDSLATLQIPALGYGIRYEFGIFQQHIVAGAQQEATDKWLAFGNPWELVRPEWAVEVKFGGHTEHYVDATGTRRARWLPARRVQGVPYDTPILGFRCHTANTLRLWRAEAPESFDFAVFNRGDYYGAVSQKVVSETLSKVLYPNDEQLAGKELRLEQQYFFVSCSLQDMLRILKVQNIPIARLHEKFAVQLNDTHPSIGVAELMRLLIDEQQMEWSEAWDITTRTFSYTNHTLLPEALECWPLAVLARILPRHLEIIFEINARFLKQLGLHAPDDAARAARMSLIDESGERQVRMAHLAIVGSHAINGVAGLHTELLRTELLADFCELWPTKLSNKTNGVTPRRWLQLANPGLASLISRSLGEGWMRNLSELEGLAAHAGDAGFRTEWQRVKGANKAALAHYLGSVAGVAIDPASLFDVQVKRFHEYKRQHLNVLQIIACYLRLRAQGASGAPPRTCLFGGKAAPGYHMAKLIIRLINGVAEVVNNDAQLREALRVVFIPNFNVSSAQRIYPAADLSEQISTAGKEASGTGNMKFQMNGALTIGTLDGANIEIRDAVGAENFFLFGHDAAQLRELRAGGYRPMDYVENDAELRAVLEAIDAGQFSNGDRELFRPLTDSLRGFDPYMVLADFRAYVDCQQRVAEAYADAAGWTRRAILNCARSGYFSSDRTIAEYCRDIWRVAPLPIRLLTSGQVQAGLMQ
jgi:starch phosphorylase